MPRATLPRSPPSTPISRSSWSTSGAWARNRNAEFTTLSASDASLADSVVNSALRFRAQAPLVDQLLREIGVDGGDLGKVARGMLEKGPAVHALNEDKPALEK